MRGMRGMRSMRSWWWVRKPTMIGNWQSSASWSSRVSAVANSRFESGLQAGLGELVEWWGQTHTWRRR